MRPVGLVHPCWISVPTLGPWSLGLVVCSSETGLLRLGTAWRGGKRGETPDRACGTSNIHSASTSGGPHCASHWCVSAGTTLGCSQHLPTEKLQFIPEGSRDAPAKRKHKLSLISSVSEV